MADFFVAASFSFSFFFSFSNPLNSIQSPASAARGLPWLTPLALPACLLDQASFGYDNIVQPTS